jgi:hypothetical protein
MPLLGKIERDLTCRKDFGYFEAFGFHAGASQMYLDETRSPVIPVLGQVRGKTGRMGFANYPWHLLLHLSFGPFFWELAEYYSGHPSVSEIWSNAF